MATTSWDEQPAAVPAARSRRVRPELRLVLGSVLLGFILLLVFVGPFVYDVSPTKGDLLDNLQPPAWFGEHPLGTDQLGRDVLARAMDGGRVSLAVAALAVLIGGLIGTILGVIAGYFEGPVGAVVMRVVDIQLSIPVILLAAILVIGLGPGFTTTVIALSVTTWVEYARLIRGQVLAYKGKDYLDSARVVGAANTRMVVRVVLPATGPLVAVVTTVAVSQVMLMESGLTFLGFGIQPPQTSWGGQLGEGCPVPQHRVVDQHRPWGVSDVDGAGREPSG